MKTVTLDQPIKREKETITEIKIRTPKAGELRGVRLSELLLLDVDALSTVIPRISEPAIYAADIAIMDPADLTAIGVEVMGFLTQKGASSHAA